MDIIELFVDTGKISGPSSEGSWVGLEQPVTKESILLQY